MWHTRTLLLVAVVGACSDPVASGNADRSVSAEFATGVRSAAARLVRAMNEGDTNVQVELAHPKLLEKIGGPAKYLASIERAKSAMEASEAPARAKVVGNPVVVRRGDRLYAIVDYDLEVTTAPGKTGGLESFLVAESDASGTSWRFLDGGGVKGDVSRLRQLLPDWPDELRLRKVGPPVFK